MNTYFRKMKGQHHSPPRVCWLHVALGITGSFLAMLCIGSLHVVCVNSTGLPLLVAPFGASTVLAFGAFTSPFAQPRNIIGGHILSAFVGISVYQWIGGQPLLAICIAVPLAIALMQLTGTVHPPGGATAFVTAAGGSAIHELGYWYILMPCALGSCIMVLIALVINNIPQKHQYPQYW